MDPSSLVPVNAEKFLYITQVYFCDAVVVWDWLISLPREWRFVWKTHWTPVKMAYLFCRYWVIAVVPYLLYSFVMDHSLETCQKIYKIPVALALWNQVGSESKHLHLVVSICAISGVVAYQLYVDTTQMDLLPFVKPPFDSSCVFQRLAPSSFQHAVLQIAPLLFDTIVTFMTIWKAFTIRRRNGGPNSRLIQTFLREGVFYYILISIANLINGIFYLQPRQVISAINIPLSVMMGPVLACRLILDLRERGSETVSHSEGTGIAAFTTKSMTQQQCSPFTPPNHRTKSGIYSRNARITDSNIVLSTLGSIPPEMDMEQDVAELENIRLGLGLDLGSLTAVGDDSDEKSEGSPAPAYSSRALEMGFRAASRSPSLDLDIRGIRVTVDVEKATSTM
ncbi:hypothetical protein C8F04DRAFT_1083059 [Mycena alexandri]|uniref:DUF6533 domain-containing protein n=1 Tax=Mycena alexandri TaxID=1745969 RepID=A0AAD6T6I3_9AGAR|nr:hypothetical protein C8F04DRAFT_1083059 [Mycena alexandri]